MRALSWCCVALLFACDPGASPEEAAAGPQEAARWEACEPEAPVAQPSVAAAPLVCPTHPELGANGFQDCDGDAANGCEVNTFDDARHCGGCGHACGGDTPDCVQARCVCARGDCPR